jgi:hypothetical protein
MSAVEKETLDEIIKRVDEKLELILEQTTRHNGRLRKLEGWRNFLLGAWAITAFAITVIAIPAVSTYIKATSNIEGQVDKAMGKYLEIER